MLLVFYRQRLLCLPFGPEKKGNSKDEKLQMCLEVEGGLYGDQCCGERRSVRNLWLKMITHLWDLTPPNVRLLCNSPKDSAEPLHLSLILVLNLDGMTKNRIDFWIDHRYCSINSERTFCTLGTREFKQVTGRQNIGKEHQNLDFWHEDSDKEKLISKQHLA